MNNVPESCGIFYIMAILAIIGWLFYTFHYDRKKSRYRKYLEKCSKINIKPFNFFQYYFSNGGLKK